MDAASSHGNWTQSAYRLSELVTNQVFVLASRQNSISQTLPASAATPDTTQSVDSSNTEQQKEEFIGSERRHHVQLSSLSQSTSPLLNSLTSHSYKSVSGDQLFKEFSESSFIPQTTDPITTDSLTPTPSLPRPPISSPSISSLQSLVSTPIRRRPQLPSQSQSPSPLASQLQLQSELLSESQHGIDDSECKVGNVLDNNQNSGGY